MNTAKLVIAHPKNEEQTNVLKAFMEALQIKFEIEKPYNPAMVEKIKKSKKQYEAGKFITVQKKDIRKFLA